jgi:hypothetical protein
MDVGGGDPRPCQRWGLSLAESDKSWPIEPIKKLLLSAWNLVLCDEPKHGLVEGRGVFNVTEVTPVDDYELTSANPRM